MTVFSPRASAMGHHIGDEGVSARWAQVSNDLVARVVQLFPAHFAGVGQLPQSPGAAASRSWASSAAISTPTRAAGTGPRPPSPTAAGTPSTRPWSSSTCPRWCTSPR
jgi:hypothetical protein